MRNNPLHYPGPSTENPDIAALAERVRGVKEPKITKLSQAREIARTRAAEHHEPVDICWDADEGSYKMRSSHKHNKGVVETVR